MPSHKNCCNASSLNFLWTVDRSMPFEYPVLIRNSYANEANTVRKHYRINIGKNSYPTFTRRQIFKIIKSVKLIFIDTCKLGKKVHLDAIFLDNEMSILLPARSNQIKSG